MKKIIAGLVLLGSVTPLTAQEISERMGDAAGDWTGFYIGAGLGYGLLTDRVGGVEDRGDDIIYSGFIGYNYQLNENFVIGIEADYTKYDIAFEKTPAISAAEGGSVRARVGYAMDDLLFFASAGVAYATTNVNLEDFGGVAGVGVEYKITENVVFGIEYTHTRFRDFDNSTIDANLDVVRARLSFKFP